MSSSSSSSSLINQTNNNTTTTKKLNIHENIRQKLQSFYISNRIPHIIFYGISGSGKQTIVYDFLKEIYHGNEHLLFATLFKFWLFLRVVS